MKIKVILLVILVGVLLSLTIILENPFTRIELDTSRRSEAVDGYKTFTYVITKIDGNEYYGQSIDGRTKIYFNSENVKHPLTDKIAINDKVLAYVETENHVDGIVKVKKIKK